MKASLFIVSFALLSTLSNASLCPRISKDKKVYKEVLRWLASEGVDPNVKELVLEYVVPFQVAQLSQIGLLRKEKLSSCGKLSLPKMIALGRSELALIRDNKVHIASLDRSSKKTQLKREDAVPTAINYYGKKMDQLVVAFSDGKVIGYSGNRVDFTVGTKKSLKVIAVSDGVLYGASEGSVDTWSIQENALLSSYPLSEAVNNLHIQGRTLFIHTTQFNHYVLKENGKKPTLLDTACRTISYGTELGERLCYGALKEITYYPSIKDRVPSWRIQHAEIIGARLVPHEKAVMIIYNTKIELVGMEDLGVVYTATFENTFIALPVGDVDVMKSGNTSDVMVREDGEGGRGAMIYRVVDRKKMIQKAMGKRSSSSCIIL